MENIKLENIIHFIEAIKDKDIKIFKEKNDVLNEVIEYYSEPTDPEYDIYEEFSRNTLDGETKESFEEFVEKNYFDIVYENDNLYLVIFSDILEDEEIDEILDFIYYCIKNKDYKNIIKFCEETSENKIKELLEKYNNQEMKDLKEIIQQIIAEEIFVYSSKEEAINSFINYYSEDMADNIFQEFARCIEEETRYNLTLNNYIEEHYSDKILKIKNMYFIKFGDELDNHSIERLLYISKAKNVEELIDFCEKNGD